MSQLIELLAGLYTRLACFISVLHFHVTSYSLSDIKLSWPGNPVQVFVHHFAPMSHPSNTSAHSKAYCKHFLWNSKCVVNHSSVIIDVWVKLSLDKVLVFQHFFFNFKCQLQDLLLLRVFFKLHKIHHLEAQILHNGCSWIIAFVNSVAKSH
jgi:hypothetical protein